MKLKRVGFIFTLVMFCLVSAAVTVMLLSYVGHTARLRVADQYTEPDYLRYLEDGYEFETVSRKSNYLFTVTSGGSPVRIHLMTLDPDKKTLDILDLPSESFIIADGFSGTLSEAFTTGVYREIIARALCIRFDGDIVISSEAFGGSARLLGVEHEKQIISYETGADIVKGRSDYISADVSSLESYRLLLSEMLERITSLGPADSFKALMDLYANKAETGMTVKELIALLNGICDISPKKMNIRVAEGCPAKFGEKTIWCLLAEGTAEQLNSHHRVKDIIYLPEALGIPKTEAGSDPFEKIEEKVSDILKQK